MSRETYQPPTLSNNTNPAGSSSSAGGGGAFNLTGSQPFDDPNASKPVKYRCGDCDTQLELKKGDAIRCKECGYRVLYKERTAK